MVNNLKYYLKIYVYYDERLWKAFCHDFIYSPNSYRQFIILLQLLDLLFILNNTTVYKILTAQKCRALIIYVLVVWSC